MRADTRIGSLDWSGGLLGGATPSDRELAGLLAAVPHLAGVRRRALRRLVRAADVVEVGPGAVLARPGRLVEQVVVLESGSAVRVRDGLVVEVIAAGGAFGIAETLSGRHVDATLIAAEPSRVVVFRPQVFRCLVGPVPRRRRARVKPVGDRWSRDRSRNPGWPG